ncbi:hypothetical protein ACE1OG_18035 [Aeromonas hydrophila]|uniref:hypothetical protein n=1 Tax=Aeromonas hydrophila TaxID=644 RepID=UPI0022AFE6D4|nr:hypothetical protein [Aeromonas hydrophila]ELB2790272.1 hypothetical protein [Aeromonas hydrophila]MCZ4335490.1 hypothetical protein [Aeromonas hydrophila]
MAEDRKARYRDISEGLLRQRRNLMVVSMLMPLFFLSGASIEKINLLGTVVSVSNPVVIKYALIILFSYFLLRYWQYYQEETYINDMRRRMRDHIYYLEERFLTKKAREKAHFVEPSILSICFSDPRHSRGVSFMAIPEKKDEVTFIFMRKCEFYIYASDRGYANKQESIDQFHVILSENEHSSWTPLDYSNGQPKFYRQYLNYSIFRFNAYRIFGFFRYIFNESYFTDYQLPFVLACGSFVVTLGAVFI